MYIAKMHTRYPEFHGVGYYNFLMDADREALDEKIEDNSHDFSLEKVIKTRFATVSDVLAKYPTKQKLNDKYFKV